MAVSEEDADVGEGVSVDEGSVAVTVSARDLGDGIAVSEEGPLWTDSASGCALGDAELHAAEAMRRTVSPAHQYRRRTGSQFRGAI